MSAPYVPPCFCELPEDVDDPGAHLPACPHYDAANDPPALADEPARFYWRVSDSARCSKVSP